MGALTKIRLFGLLVIAAITLALAGVGYAHHAPSAEDARIEAYVLAGGALDDICGAGASHHLATSGCPACHLIGSALLPAPTDSFLRIEGRILATIVLPQQRRAASRASGPALHLRGPPALA